MEIKTFNTFDFKHFALSICMLLLSTWLIIAHFSLSIHIVFDEILMDLLILLDVYIQIQKQGCKAFLYNIRNWPPLFLLWFCILYWITQSVLPLIDFLDTIFLFTQSLIQVFRIGYSFSRTFLLLKTYRAYAILPTSETCSDELELKHFIPHFEEISELDEEIEVEAKQSISDSIRESVAQLLKTNAVPLFDTELHGFSLVTIKSKLPFRSGTGPIVWIIRTADSHIGLLFQSYVHVPLQTVEKIWQFDIVDNEVHSVLLLHKTVISLNVGRFELHSLNCSLILQDELQRIYFSKPPSISVDSDVRYIKIYPILIEL